MTKRKTLLYHVARATMTLLIMLLTTATAWAEDNVPYLDPTAPVGQQSKTQDNVTVLTGNEITSDDSPLQGGWYIVKGTINYSSTLYFDGDVKLILENGCNMNIGTENSPITSRPGGITASSSADCTFTIYGQSGNTGNLNLNIADQSGYWVCGISAYAAEDNHYSIIVNGGNIYINAEGNGIDTDGDFTINGGSITVNVDGAGIYADQNMAINGGSIGVTGYEGIMAGEEIRIKDGEINASVPYGQSISAEYVTIEGGTVTVNSDDGEYGIYASKNIIIKDGTVTVSKDGEQTDDAEEAIHAAGTINITGGTVVANGYYWGIYAVGNITIDGGNITATAIRSGSEYGSIYSDEGNIIITDGIINADGGDSGIYALSGSVTISGGEVVAGGEYYGIYIYNSGNTDNSGNITISGGIINATGGNYGIDVHSDKSIITINGGDITATGSYGGIKAKSITLGGGIVNATATSDSHYGIGDEGGTITLNWGTVTSSGYNGTLTVAEGLTYSDGKNNNIKGTVDTSNYGSETTLSVSSTTLTANEATVESSTNYWTTFYFGSTGFTIGNNACAYTATYGLNSETNEYELTLHKLGKNIPQGTAVIIVSSSASVSMTSNSSLGTFSGPNNLHGVDVRTATDDITSILGSGTFYVMGKKENDFGFFKYTADYMPARKAFLLINSSNEALARGISMVFDDATGIKSIDKAQISTASDAWYSLDGRKLLVKPTTKGVYINNGNKVIIK